MFDWLEWLFDSSPFVTRPECGGWTEGLIWLTVASDVLIWLAYMAIPVILFHVARKRPDFKHRWVLWMFVAFILTCGFTHFFDMMTFYDPHYRLSGVVRALTAAASWITVAALVPLTPRFLAMKSPDVLEAEIDRRKAAEAQLRDAHDDLERRVEERTRELESANAALKISNSELEEFAYAASHDLQEPLRKIHQFSALLEEEVGGDLPGDSTLYIGRMRGAADRMGAMINDLLQLSRSSRGDLKVAATSLEKMIEHVLDDLETSIREAEAHIEVGELPDVRADAVQLEIVIRNLLGNALKYRSKEHRLHVSITSRKLDGGMVEVILKDNGIGFEQEYAERIFKPFQRLHGRNEYEGSGIGLALCRKIIERHGGAIHAVGRPGEGATFRFTIPAGEEA